MKLKFLIAIVFVFFLKTLNCQTIDIPIIVFVDNFKIENNDCLLNITLISKKKNFLIVVTYNNQKVTGHLYNDELLNIDSIYFYIETINKHKKANIGYIIVSKNAPTKIEGYYRTEDCSYNSHDIMLYVKKDMNRKKRNYFIEKFILTKCKIQIYIQEIKSKRNN
jgi:hypothetical protein